MRWPSTPEALIVEQERLARARPAPWTPPESGLAVAGCFVCFPRGEPGAGAAGDPGWAAAALVTAERRVLLAAAVGAAGGDYRPGLLALREGPLLEAALSALPVRPTLLVVNATGRDHPRRAGLALHLGALLALPSVGVTHRPLLARGDWPEPARGATSPLVLDGELVGHWLRTRGGARPLAVHAAWRTTPETAVTVVLAASTKRARTPTPLRRARQAARKARARAERKPAR